MPPSRRPEGRAIVYTRKDEVRHLLLTFSWVFNEKRHYWAINVFHGVETCSVNNLIVLVFENILYPAIWTQMITDDHCLLILVLFFISIPLGKVYNYIIMFWYISGIITENSVIIDWLISENDETYLIRETRFREKMSYLYYEYITYDVTVAKNTKNLSIRRYRCR